MNPKRRLLTAMIAATAGFAFVGPAIAKHAHHSGAQLLGNKIKENGEHVIHHGGPHTVSVRVTNGKIAGMTVKHDTKGNLPVKKYKTTKKMAQTGGLTFVSYPLLAQAYSAGTVYIGYAYIDDYGDEQIYWWPYEMIVDGDTGAVEYIPYA